MQLSATAFTVLCLCAAQSAQATDYDFRNFEGWWEGIFSPDFNTLFNCTETNDWRKAECEYIISMPEDSNCDMTSKPPSITRGKIIKSQFDADKGVVKALMPDISCCEGNPIQCDVKYRTAIQPFNLGPPVGGKKVTTITFKQLSGRSNKLVRAVEIDYFGTKREVRRVGGGFKSLS